MAAGEVQARWWERLIRSPLLVWWVVSLALAVLSAVVWPTVPSYDPWSWVVWGREVSDPHLSFFVGGGPSWKPLPFLFTTIYGTLGGIAPTLWVITARTGGIAGLIAAWRLAGLLTRRAGIPVAAGYVAGAVAVLGIVLTDPASGWTYYFFRGTSEPLLVGVWLWSAERLIARRHGQAFGLLAAEGLMRPEAWPFLLLYGAWLFWKRPGLRPWVLVGLAAQPIGWFVPPWISTGHPLLAATHAAEYNGHLGANWLATVLSRGETLQPVPSLALGLAAVALTLWRGRDRVVLGIAAAAAVWWVIVVGMTWDGYPGLQRFFLPAAALICVLAGLGLVRLAALAGEAGGALLRGARLPGGGRARAVAALLAGVVLLVACSQFLGSRVSYARAQEPLAATAARRIDQLGAAVTALGGHDAILPCPSSVVTVNHSLQSALAWKLHTTLERVQTVLNHPGVAFVGPHDSIDGGEPPIDRRLSVHRQIGRVGDWRLYQVYAPGPKPRCLGR